MIGILPLRVSAHNPQMPLTPIFSFKGSPSSFRLMDVPKGIGTWAINRVYIKVTSPDNSLKLYDCVRQGSVWIGTIDGTEIVGKVKKGIEILADGVDENGSMVQGYVLGVADYIVLERDSTISDKDIEKFYVKYSDQLPINPAKGDMMVFEGSVRIFNGEEWIDCGKRVERLSQLENDVGFITQADVKTPQYIENELETYRLFANGEWLYRTRDFITGEFGPWQPLGDLCTEQTAVQLAKDEGNAVKRELREEIPTKVSQMENDRNFVSRSTVTAMLPTKVSQLENDKKYLAIVPDGARDSGFDKTVYGSWINNDLGWITSSALDPINEKIPEQASPTNQLADKDFVNSSIMTNTAYFKGTFNSVDELPTDRVTPNDYAFVIGQDSEGNTTYNRYKFTADGEWLFEYTLNNSSFTSNQWATINSGITATTLDDYAKKDEIDNTKILADKDIDIDNPKEGDIYISGDGRKFKYIRDLSAPWGIVWDENDPNASTHDFTINVYEGPDNEWFADISVIDEDDQDDIYIEHMSEYPTEMDFTYYTQYHGKAVKGLGVYKWEVVSLATSDEIPTKMSDLQNDKGFLTNKDIEPSTNPIYEGEGVAFKSEFADWATYAEYVNWTAIHDKPDVLDAPENIATKSDIQNQPFATLSGEYEDGTTFSLDFVVKS